MAKSIKELKKENLFLKNKSEKSDVTLIVLVEEVSFAQTYNIFFCVISTQFTPARVVAIFLNT